MIDIKGSGSSGTTDIEAIHKNIAGEILSLDLKQQLNLEDVLIIEDSSDGYIKARTTIGDVLSGNIEIPWKQVLDFDSEVLPEGKYTLKLFEDINSFQEQAYGLLHFDLKIDYVSTIAVYSFSIYIPKGCYYDGLNNKPSITIKGEGKEICDFFVVSNSNNILEFYFETYFSAGANVYVREYHDSIIDYSINDPAIISSTSPPSYKNKITLDFIADNIGNDISLQTNKIVDSADPINDQDLVTKKYFEDNDTGENNTASNIGSSGIGLYDKKQVYDLEFKNISPGSNNISVKNSTDGTNVEIDVKNEFRIAFTGEHSKVPYHYLCITPFFNSIQDYGLMHFSFNLYTKNTTISIETYETYEVKILIPQYSLFNENDLIPTISVLGEGYGPRLLDKIYIESPDFPYELSIRILLLDSDNNTIIKVTDYSDSQIKTSEIFNVCSGNVQPNPLDVIQSVTVERNKLITSYEIINIPDQDNTASNIGSSGIGLYNDKVGVDLQFKNISPGSDKVTTTLSSDTTNIEIDIDSTKIEELGSQTSNMDLGNHNINNVSDPLDVLDATNMQWTQSQLSLKQDILTNGSQDLTTLQVDQLKNIETATISSDTWNSLSKITGNLDFRETFFFTYSFSEYYLVFNIIDSAVGFGLCHFMLIIKNIEEDNIETYEVKITIPYNSLYIEEGEKPIIEIIGNSKGEKRITELFFTISTTDPNKCYLWTSFINLEAGDRLFIADFPDTQISLPTTFDMGGGTSVPLDRKFITQIEPNTLNNNFKFRPQIYSLDMNHNLIKNISVSSEPDSGDAVNFNWIQTRLDNKQNLITNGVDNLTIQEVQSLSFIEDSYIQYKNWKSLESLVANPEYSTLVENFSDIGEYHIPIQSVTNTNTNNKGTIYNFNVIVNNITRDKVVEFYNVEVIIPSSSFRFIDKTIEPIIKLKGSKLYDASVGYDSVFLKKIVVEKESLPNVLVSICFIGDGDIYDIIISDNPGAKNNTILGNHTPISGYPSNINILKELDFNELKTVSSKDNSGTVKIESNGDNTKPTYTLISGIPQQIEYISPKLKLPAYYPENTYNKDIISIYYDYSIFGGCFIENQILGQLQHWRISLDYSNKVLNSNVGLYFYLINPISGFIRKKLLTLPDGETSNTNLVFDLITYADENSLLAPLGTGIGGYQFFIESIGDDLDITIQDITRLNNKF